MIPDTIGRYQVQGLLGEGAFGQVFAAHDPTLGRSVAIKVLRTIYSSDTTFMDRFRAEAASLAALAHPNITAIHDLLQTGSQHGMIMELVRGHTLEHVIELKRRLSPQQAIAVVVQVAAGLDYVHRRGVVHRDIKPANIMLTADGVPKIMDFGIARIEGTKRLTRDGSVVGTLAYAAPEQIKTGAGEPRSDQYSLACMLYEMLCGNPPFDAASEYELMQAQIAQPPEPASTHVPGLSQDVDRALLRALAKNPAERFESVEAFGRALDGDIVPARMIDIVRELVASAGPIAPLPLPRTPAGPANEPASQAMGPQQTAAPSAANAPRSSSLKPMVTMAAAAVVAIGVGSYIFLDSRAIMPSNPGPAAPEKPSRPEEIAASAQNQPSPPPRDIATNKELEPARPSEASRAPESHASAPPANEPRAIEPRAPEPRAVEARPATPPENSLRPERLPSPSLDVPPVRRLDDPGEPVKPRIARSPDAEPAAPRIDPRPAPRPGDPPPAKADAPRTEENVAARQPDKPLVRPSEPAPGMPAGPPNYRGRVLNWPSGGTIRVRAATGTVPEFFRLFGVRDLQSVKKQSDYDALSDKLESFFAANGREATCFKRYSTEFKDTRYLCFIGSKDIGLWAIENGLAEATNDAPPHYRQVGQR